MFDVSDKDSQTTRQTIITIRKLRMSSMENESKSFSTTEHLVKTYRLDIYANVHSQKLKSNKKLKPTNTLCTINNKKSANKTRQQRNCAH